MHWTDRIEGEDARAWARLWGDRCPVIVRGHSAGEPNGATVRAVAVADWAANWPCDGLPRRAIFFGYDGDDLCEVRPENVDGEAAAVLATDALDVARAWVARRAWVDPATGAMLRRLPQECLVACSGPGPADGPVAEWVKRLGFWVYRRPAVAYLARLGAWDRDALGRETDATLAERALWLLCGQAYDEAWEGRHGKGPDWRPRRLPQPFGLTE